MAFIDFKKAFNTIDRSLFLFIKLCSLELDGKMIEAIKTIYRDVQCCVRINGERSDWLTVTSGLKQGCKLSCMLFNIFINDLATFLEAVGVVIEVSGELICSLLYADDLVLMA